MINHLDSFNVMTLNLHCGMEQDYDNKLIQLCKGIADNTPLVIAFQECVQHKDAPVINTDKGVPIKEGNLAYRISQILREEHQLDYDIYFDWAHYGYAVYEEGCALLSLVPITHYESRVTSVDANVNRWVSRKNIRITIDLEGIPLDIYSVHFGWWDDPNEPFKYQIEQQKLWHTSNYLSIMMGDFNNPPNSPGYDYMMSVCHMKDLYALANPDGFYDATFISRKPNSIEAQNESARIDFIMAPSADPSVLAEIEALSMTRIYTESDYGLVSDHVGLLGTLKVHFHE